MQLQLISPVVIHRCYDNRGKLIHIRHIGRYGEVYLVKEPEFIYKLLRLRGYKKDQIRSYREVCGKTQVDIDLYNAPKVAINKLKQNPKLN